MGLKDILGDSLYAQVTAALKGKGENGKDVELAIANDGSVLPKSKFDELNEKYKAAEQLARDTKKQLDDLKAAGDPAELAEQLKSAKEAAKAAEDKHKADMGALELDYAVRAALTEAQDAGIVTGLLDKSKLKFKDGAVEGLDDQLKNLRESKPFLFKVPEQPTKPAFTGRVPASPTAPPGGTDITEMSMEEYRAYRNQAGGFPKN